MDMLRRQIIFIGIFMIKSEIYFTKTKIETIQTYARRINDEISGDEIGYYHLPLYKDSLNFTTTDFEKIVLVGIGGSSVGVRAVYDLLSQKAKREILFLDNLDEALIEQNLNKINFGKTLFIISSKSGTTIETITTFKIIISKFDVKNFANFIFITDKDSALDKFGKENGVKTYHIPKNVGGRFSVLSAVGLVPLGLCGFDTSELLKGAKTCYEKFVINQDCEILQKAYHYATHHSAKINAVFAYLDKFESFNKWYIQLWAESLGKKRGYKRVGLTPVGLIGPKDQHSFLQLIMDGVRDKTITFIKVEPNDELEIPNLSLKFLEGSDIANGISLSKLRNHQCNATIQALVSQGLCVDTITLDAVDEWHIGYLLYYYELLTSATGIMLGINTYDQPGVEAGKIILKTMLTR